MITIKKRLSEAITRAKPIIEERMNVKLGKIKVEPLSEYYTLLSSERVPYLSFLEFSFALTAKAADTRVFYSRNPALHLALPSNKHMLWLAAHELGHIAHSRLIGKSIEDPEGIAKLPEFMSEGFAEYIAREVVISLGSSGCKPWSPIYGNHSSYLRQLEEVLRLNGVRNLEEAIQYMRTSI
ncbi:MAG: hypothetical protein AABW79_03240 [Nanoarchaeota archaeon]